MSFLPSRPHSVSRKLLCSTAFALLPFSLSAQEVLELDQIVVTTASGIETTVQDAPASITVIDQETIAQEGARDLNDLLRLVPGLNLTRGNDGISKVSFRGISSNRTLTLVDGRRISTGKSFARHYQGDLNVVPLDAIERIEIVRGPMSTLYGSDAMGGVVNIITKKPSGVWSGSITTDFGFGEHATTGDNRQISGYVSGSLSETVDVEFWGKTSEREAPDAFTYTDGTGAENSVYGSDGSSARELGARLTWRPNGAVEWGFEATTGQETYLASDGAHDTNKIDRDGFAITNEWMIGAGTLSSYLRYEDSSNASWSDPAWGDPITYKTTTFETRYSAETLLGGKGFGYTVGGSVAKDELSDPATNRDGALISGEAVASALYAEGRWDVTEALTLTTGLRYDHHEDFGDHFTPRLYANYDLGNGLMLKAGYAQAFVAPDLRALNPNYKMSSRGNGCKPYPGPCIIYGNPDIGPETSDNYEIGLNSQGGVFNWELTAFYNDITDMIGARKTGEVDLSTGYDIFERTNIESGKTAGIEGGFSFDVSEDLTWTSSFTYLAKSEFKYEGLDHAFPMATTPKWNITTGASWVANDRLTLSGNVTYVGKQVGYVTEDELSTEEARAVPAGQNKNPYFLVDVAMAYDLTDKTRLNLGIDNLFDQQPADETAYRENGRLFKLGLTTSF
ncbi:TonB-dependent receptor domain-containing protein [Celeribacter ethanolicus]|uniref:TonB-dependent receptor domain-containing protein n=1 Tax=Celeribacter ethanolicus TaxID=1758178 RepID=UPI000AC1149F|nr:TonB-dependent receptor [Celeribacter ethanolicus]